MGCQSGSSWRPKSGHQLHFGQLILTNFLQFLSKDALFLHPNVEIPSQGSFLLQKVWPSGDFILPKWNLADDFYLAALAALRRQS